MSLKYVQSNTFYLAGSGVVIGATSVVLTNFQDIYGNVLTMSDFGTTGYCTSEPDTVNEEAFIFTGVVANSNGTYTLTGVSTILARSPYTPASGLVRGHSGGTKVVITDNVGFWNTFTNKHNDETVDGQWTFTNTPIVPGVVSDASTTVKGVSKLSVAAVSPTNPIVVGDNDVRVPTADPTTLFAPISVGASGIVSPYAGRSAPIGWLLCDGTAVSRSTYAALFSIIAPSGAFTVTIASPGVFSKTAHGLVAGDKIHFTTTGVLPTGLATNTDYYVISTGLTTDAFEVALSPAGTAINTSGSQSGVHTLYASAWGKGDGSTTFNLPDLRSKVPVALSVAAPTMSLAFQGAQRSTNDITIVDSVFPAQGQKVQLTTTGALPTGLSTSTDYYIIRNSATSIAFATSQANANAATKISLSGDGSGVNTMTYTMRAHTVLGKVGGEETHAQAATEVAAHIHSISTAGGGLSGSAQNNGNTPSGSVNTNLNSGDGPHNNIQPYAVMNYIIKT